MKRNKKQSCLIDHETQIKGRMIKTLKNQLLPPEPDMFMPSLGMNIDLSRNSAIFFCDNNSCSQLPAKCAIY
jgi:hypothetical protein